MRRRTKGIIGVTLLAAGLAVSGGSVLSQLRMDVKSGPAEARKLSPAEDRQMDLNCMGMLGGGLSAAYGVAFLAVGGWGWLMRKDQPGLED